MMWILMCGVKILVGFLIWIVKRLKVKLIILSFMIWVLCLSVCICFCFSLRWGKRCCWLILIVRNYCLLLILIVNFINGCLILCWLLKIFGCKVIKLVKLMLIFSVKGICCCGRVLILLVVLINCMLMVFGCWLIFRVEFKWIWIWRVIIIVIWWYVLGLI